MPTQVSLSETSRPTYCSMAALPDGCFLRLKRLRPRFASGEQPPARVYAMSLGHWGIVVGLDIQNNLAELLSGLQNAQGLAGGLQGIAGVDHRP
jgi:hypothetical protein